MNESIAIVGRTNVGKSLLFNKLTKARKALVINYHGVTRDVNSGYIELDGKTIYIEDTGGIPEEADQFSQLIINKVLKSISQAKLILFVVSAADGLTNQDHEICKMLRKLDRKTVLLINKCDLTRKSQPISEFYELGMNEVFVISAKNNIGLNELKEKISSVGSSKTYVEKDIFRRISIIGKPNAGKSTLINTILHEERMIISDIAGTTLDAIEIPFKFKDNNFLLYDTAGITRKSKTITTLQKFSIGSTLETIKTTDICVFMIDAEEGITKQDKIILNIIKKYNKAFIILISAISNQNIKKLLYTISNISYSIYKRYKSSLLTEILNQALEEHQPPMVNNRRIRLKFAQQAKSDSLSIIIFGNQTDKLPTSYEKYLKNFFISKLKLVGVPLRITLSKQKNPFE
jgi:GTP-binding protein